MKLEESIVFAAGRFRKYDDARVGSVDARPQLRNRMLRRHPRLLERRPSAISCSYCNCAITITRLHTSARILMMDLPHTVDELVET